MFYIVLKGVHGRDIWGGFKSELKADKAFNSAYQKEKVMTKRTGAFDGYHEYCLINGLSRVVNEESINSDELKKYQYEVLK